MAKLNALIALVLLAGLISAGHVRDEAAQGTGPAAPPDISGLAWLRGGTFLAVHDAKIPEELDGPRVSLVRLPGPHGGIEREPLRVSWPEGGAPSHDLESVARIPGTSEFLLLESGDDGAGHRRIFLADLEGGEVRIKDAVVWPAAITNVEGAAVAEVGGRRIFVYAERGQGRRSVEVAWAPLTVEPLGFGSFRTATFTSPDPSGAGARPVSALEIDDRGRIYTASTFDLDDDDGPFRSVVWDAGRVILNEGGEALVVMHARPVRLAASDGFKVESLAVRETLPGCVELFVGTDDENYGGVVRPLPLRVDE